jgi:hypothetical protein
MPNYKIGNKLLTLNQFKKEFKLKHRYYLHLFTPRFLEILKDFEIVEKDLYQN